LLFFANTSFTMDLFSPFKLKNKGVMSDELRKKFGSIQDELKKNLQNNKLFVPITDHNKTKYKYRDEKSGAVVEYIFSDEELSLIIMKTRNTIVSSVSRTFEIKNNTLSFTHTEGADKFELGDSGYGTSYFSDQKPQQKPEIHTVIRTEDELEKMSKPFFEYLK